MIFNGQQERALLAVRRWLVTRETPYFYLAGYAGTGKTTLARHLAEGVEGEVLFGAFTGKAASVLREKGCPNARTLHSILYEGADDWISERIRQLRHMLADPEHAHEEDLISELNELRGMIRKKDIHWKINPDSPLKTAALLILDECSMINTELARDTLSFGTPVLVLGDPAQLPPVMGAGYFTNGTPDVLLTEIHRQAKGSAILTLATAIRNEDRYHKLGHPEVHWAHKGDVDFKTLPLDTQILTGKNTVRRYLNVKRRDGLHFNGTQLPCDGDKLVCLKNDREMGFLNGVICWSAGDSCRVDDEVISLDVIYDGLWVGDVPTAAAPFDKYVDPSIETDCLDRSLQAFDYGYALTVHKAQGSQWDDVVIADDHFGTWNPKLRRRWLYTAVTRAAKTLTIVE